MRCPSCGHENPDGVKFCGECGNSLQGCPHCGFSNPLGTKFYHECGQGLTEATKQATATDPRSYTPPRLAEKILRERAALEGERRTVTVLFGVTIVPIRIRVVAITIAERATAGQALAVATSRYGPTGRNRPNRGPRPPWQAPQVGEHRRMLQSWEW